MSHFPLRKLLKLLWNIMKIVINNISRDHEAKERMSSLASTPAFIQSKVNAIQLLKITFLQNFHYRTPLGTHQPYYRCIYHFFIRNKTLFNETFFHFKTLAI